MIVRLGSARITSSGTNAPFFMSDSAFSPTGLPCAIAWRSMSPVEICGIPYCCWIRPLWVPLPEPGAPSRMIRIATVAPLAHRIRKLCARTRPFFMKPS